jgi:hypothetical protein
MDKSLASADDYSVPAFGTGSVLIYANSLMGCLAVGFLASPRSAQEPDHLPRSECDAVDMVLLLGGIPRAAAAAA